MHCDSPLGIGDGNYDSLRPWSGERKEDGPAERVGHHMALNRDNEQLS